VSVFLRIKADIYEYNNMKVRDEDGDNPERSTVYREITSGWTYDPDLVTIYL